LKSLFSVRARQDKPTRDAAIRRACLEYGYTMEAVACEAGIFDDEQDHQVGKMNTVTLTPHAFFTPDQQFCSTLNKKIGALQ